MARSDILTAGMLNRWPIVMTEDLFVFNQILGAGIEKRACPVYTQQHRDDIARTLHDALRRAAPRFGYWPRPDWFPQAEPGSAGEGGETEGYERVQLRHGTPLSRQTLKTRWGYLQAFGQRASSLIQADVAVVYSDSNGDGALDRATITLTSTVAANEIAVFFRVADGAESAGDIRWQIDDVRVSKSGNTVTIIGSRALFVSPSSVWAVPYESPNYDIIHAGSNSVAADFVSFVDIYRVYNDAANACRLVYYDADGVESYVSVTPRIMDRRLGRFTFHPDCNSLCAPYPPFAVDVRYYAGYPLQNGKMDATLEEAYVRLANTYIPYDQCSFCDRVNSRYVFDRSDAPLTINSAISSLAFGRLRGQINMQQVIWDMALGQGGRL